MPHYRFASTVDWLRVPAVELTLTRGPTLTLLYPRCAHCLRAVDLLTAVDKPDTNEVLLTSFCHAQREQIHVPRHLLLQDSRVTMQEAFRSPTCSVHVVTNKVLC